MSYFFCAWADVADSGIVSAAPAARRKKPFFIAVRSLFVVSLTRWSVPEGAIVGWDCGGAVLAMQARREVEGKGPSPGISDSGWTLKAPSRKNVPYGPRCLRSRTLNLATRGSFDVRLF